MCIRDRLISSSFLLAVEFDPNATVDTDGMPSHTTTERKRHEINLSDDAECNTHLLIIGRDAMQFVQSLKTTVIRTVNVIFFVFTS